MAPGCGMGDASAEDCGEHAAHCYFNLLKDIVDELDIDLPENIRSVSIRVEEKMTVRRIPCIDMTKCTKCHKCIAACPRDAIVVRKNSDDFFSCTKCVKYCLQFENITCKPENVCIIFEQCDACGACVNVCDYGAIEWVDTAGNG